MPYFDPSNSYVLWSFIYLAALGVVSLAAHIAKFKISNMLTNTREGNVSP
ncbi:MAG: hypothetical protein ACWGOX_10130 [Desulforhopalus sp.]